jgi:hypothetical protein
MQLTKILFALVVISCTAESSSVQQGIEHLALSSCGQVGVVCEIEQEPSDVPELVAFRYRLCCPSGQFSASVLEVTGNEGNWGDVTRWVSCGHAYVEEFTHPLHANDPWAILSVFDGKGGPISSCRTPNAPVD